MRCLLASIFLLLLLTQMSCNNANVEEDFPPPPCTTTTATFRLDVLPIIQDNCYECHDTNTRFGGVFLEGYANVADYAKNGVLGHVLRGTGGLPIMPTEVAMLECDIMTLEQWILEGAQNN